MNHLFALRRRGSAAVAAASVVLLLSGCAGAGAPRPIVVGTTSDIVSLDPASTSDATTTAFLHQLYPRLVELDAATGEIDLSLAESADFTSDTEYTVTLPTGLEFPNGDDLTASDVVFSFERQLAIGETTGPVALLRGLQSVAALDTHTVVFTLREADDVTFPAVLAGPAGAILDEEICEELVASGEPNPRLGRFPLIIISHRNAWAMKELHNIFLQSIHPFY